MIFKENISKLSKSPQITFLFICVLIQELFFIYNFPDLYSTFGHNSSFLELLNNSKYSFFVFFSSSLLINLIYFMILSLITLIFINFNKLISIFIVLAEIAYSLFIFYDIKVYKTLGVHLYDNTVLAFLNKKSLENDILMKENIFDFKTIFFFLVIIVSMVFISFLLFFISKKVSRIFNMPYIIKNTIALFLLAFIFSIFSYLRAYPILSVVPFYSLIENDINLEWIKPKYPDKISENIKVKKTPNIVLVLSESTRSDMQTEELMPNITNFIKNNENCIKSRHNFAGAHTTFPSLFSTIYGIYGYNNLFFNNQVTQTEPVTLKFLKDNNYESIFLTASSLEASYGIKKITKFFDIYKFFKYKKNGQPDIDMINWFRDFYQKRDNKKPFFVILFMRSPHYAYDYPKKFERYKPVIELNDKNIALDSKYMSKKYKNQLFNRYKNSILFTDDLFKELTNSLKEEIDNENLILFYSGDHGEEFWEKGKFGHFSTSFIKERVETPLLFCLPKIKKTNVNISTNTDFFPTVINYMTSESLNKRNNLDKYFDGISLLNKEKTENRFLIISTHSIAGTNTNMSLVNNLGKVNIKYSSRKISNVAKFSYNKFMDFNDKEIKNKKHQKILKSDIKKFESSYTRFLKMQD